MPQAKTTETDGWLGQTHDQFFVAEEEGERESPMYFLTSFFLSRWLRKCDNWQIREKRTNFWV